MKTDLRKNEKNDFEKFFFSADEECSFLKDYGKCEKT